jgi:hypothetical protein
MAVDGKGAPAGTPAPGRRPRSVPSGRVLAIGLLGTGLFATGLTAAADAQGPAITATSTPDAG